jgi:hypothetical protein
MAISTVIDIDGVPTAIVSRGDNKPPIILYTIPPPPYSHYKSHRLIMEGPPPLIHSPPQLLHDFHDDDSTNDRGAALVRIVGVLALVCLFGFCVSVIIIARLG